MKLNRIQAIDTFRGLTLIGFVAVYALYGSNTDLPLFSLMSEDSYSAGDLLLPFMLFIAGVSLSLSFSKLSIATSTFGILHKKLGKRALITLGISLLFIALEQWTIDSDISSPVWALHRLALSLYIVGVIHLLMPRVLDKLMVVIGLLAIQFVGTMVYTSSEFLSVYLWSMVGSIVSMLSGLILGIAFFDKPYEQKRFWTFLLLGLGVVWVGTLLDLVWTVNALVWNLSFMLIVMGWAIMVFCLLYLFVDIYKLSNTYVIKRWANVGRYSFWTSIVLLLLYTVLRSINSSHLLFDSTLAVADYTFSYTESNMVYALLSIIALQFLCSFVARKNNA